MSIKDIGLVLKKRWRLIIVVALFTSLSISLTFSFLVKPSYQASEYLLIGDLQSESETHFYEEVQKIPQIIASAIDFIQSPVVLEASEAELGLAPGTLKNQLSVQNSQNSQLISITVTDKDPIKAKETAHTLAVTAIEKMNTTMKFTNVSLLEKSSGVAEQSSILNNYALAALIGLLAGLGSALAIEQFNGSVKNEKMAEEVLGVPVLGSLRAKETMTRSKQASGRK